MLSVVKSGIYSDKMWHGIFSTREKAEELHKTLLERKGCWRNCEDRKPQSDDPRIEEWELDKLPELEPGVFAVTIDSAGEVHEVEFESWRMEVPGPTEWLRGLFMGHGRTTEEARRSAEVLRRASLVLRGLTGEPSER